MSSPPRAREPGTFSLQSPQTRKEREHLGRRCIEGRPEANDPVAEVECAHLSVRDGFSQMSLSDPS